jgi:hypothetical protein
MDIKIRPGQTSTLPIFGELARVWQYSATWSIFGNRAKFCQLVATLSIFGQHDPP